MASVLGEDADAARTHEESDNDEDCAPKDLATEQADDATDN